MTRISFFAVSALALFAVPALANDGGHPASSHGQSGVYAVDHADGMTIKLATGSNLFDHEIDFHADFQNIGSAQGGVDHADGMTIKLATGSDSFDHEIDFHADFQNIDYHAHLLNAESQSNLN